MENNLKSYNTQINRLSAEIDSTRSEIALKQRELALKKKTLQEIKKKINSMTETNILVTEHAKLRYVERVMGIDLEKVTNAILTESVKKQVAILGDGSYPAENCKAVIKNNTVVTVINE